MVEKAAECVDVLFTLLRLFGLKDGISCAQSFAHTVDKWARGMSAVGWMVFLKYKLSAYVHARTVQWDENLPSPLPLALNDDPRHICSGTAGRFCQILLRGPHKDAFIQSVMVLKKGMPRPSEEEVKASVNKTVTALTTPREDVVTSDKPFLVPMDWFEEKRFKWTRCRPYLDKQNMIAQLHRTVDELFKFQKYTEPDRLHPYFPSTSSTNVDSRKDGGATNSLREILAELGIHGAIRASPQTVHNKGLPREIIVPSGEGYVVFELDSVATGVQQGNQEFLDIANSWSIAHLDNPQSSRARPTRLGEEEIGAGEHAYQVDITKLEVAYGDFYKHLLTMALHEPAVVIPIGLAESLKIRVITKGPPCTGFVLKPLQKFMWRTLAKHPAFSLIGKPVDVWEVQKRLGRQLEDGYSYLSGDYSAATDNLAPWVSEAIAHRIAENIGLSDGEEELFIRALTQHLVRHSLPGLPSTDTPQTWGQLMGSVVSFPVLCIANAAMCRWVIELTEGITTSLARTSLMINGDDVLFKTNINGLRLWKRITAFGGLTPSIGKFYFSPEFAQINSRNFVRLKTPVMDTDSDGVEREREFSMTSFVNLGIAFGLKRSGEVGAKDVADNPDKSLGSLARELVRDSPAALRADVLDLFMKRNGHVLKEIHVPWYIPEAFGGVGLPVTDRHSPSQLDLRVCARLLENPDLFPVVRPIVDTPWQVHKLVLGKLPTKPEAFVPSEQEERNWSRVYSALVVESFFRDPLIFVGNHKPDPETNLRALRQNERMWRKALHKGDLPPPLSLLTVSSIVPPRKLIRISDITDFAAFSRFRSSFSSD